MSQSYSEHISGSSVAPGEIDTGNNPFTTSSAQAGLQAFIQPFFAPGILYNTIKSGIAVDWPSYTGSYAVSSSQGASVMSRYANLSSSNNYRMQFETLYDMSKMPINTPIRTVANAHVNDFCIYDGNKTHNLYELAIHNFLAESVNLFLKDGELTSFVSKPMKNVAFETGKTYRMKVQLEMNSGSVMTQGARHNILSDAYQISSSYGRLYGPAVRFTENIELTGGFIGFENCDPAYAPYTPPYFYGKSTVILEYQNTVDDTNTPTLSTIINNMSSSYSCSVDTNIPNFTDGSVTFTSRITASSPAMQNLMPLSASINLFGKRVLEKSQYDQFGILSGLQDAEDISQFEQLVISTKYECPVLEFKNYDNQFKARGMWNNYGSLPAASEGLELRILPPSEAEKATDNVEDLRAILFDKNNPLTSTTNKKIGELGLDYEKSISEAIVAIPYIQNPHKLNKKIQDYLTPVSLNDTNLNCFKIFSNEESSESTLNLENQLQRYVFPPAFDFYHMPNIDRFVMFVFEFEQKLKRSDLQDIWQGIMPECARQITEEESSLAFSTEANQMLSSFLKDCTSNILDDRIITTTFNNLKWLVFKVKQRARNNYSGITPDSSDDIRIQNTQGRARLQAGDDLPYSYNWPYDYCSLVELGNITADLTLSTSQAKISRGAQTIKGTQVLTQENVMLPPEQEEPCEPASKVECCPPNSEVNIPAPTVSRQSHGPAPGHSLQAPAPTVNSLQSGGPGTNNSGY